MPSLRSTLQTSAAACHAKPHPRPGAMLWAAVCTVSLLCSGCAVVAVADAAVTVVSTTVKVGATVVGTTVDIGAAGVRAVVGKDED
ncbi:hypothetical protein [Acidovorax sp. 106]|uniref:hypothetical protein n=1 Tax=Acidovorax sp. 106 TaxID=2135637 RepID=UPI001F48A12F|nr:hypothetical protein [Acidovorax sp. 106]